MNQVNISIDTVMTWLPEGRDTSIMQDADFAILAMTEYKFVTVDGKDQAINNAGNPVTDTVTLSPVHPKKVIADFFQQRGWNKKTAVVDNGLNTYSKFQRDWMDKNPGMDENGPEFQTAIAKHAGEQKQFNWYE